MTPQNTLTYFQLPHDPFEPIRSVHDMYMSRTLRGCEMRTSTTIESGGMVAIVGQTGIGKTALIERSISQMEGMHVVRIRTVSRSRLSGTHLCDAIMEDIAAQKPYGSLEGRARQVGNTLSGLHARGSRAVLILDDAHEISTQTLRDVKKLHEIVGVFSRPLAIAIIGQPPLTRRLSSEIPLREIQERIEVVDMPAVDVKAYVGWRFAQAGARGNQVFLPCGIDALDHPDTTTPISVDNLARRAMILAASIGEKVSAEVIAHARLEPVPASPIESQNRAEAA